MTDEGRVGLKGNRQVKSEDKMPKQIHRQRPAPVFFSNSLIIHRNFLSPLSPSKSLSFLPPEKPTASFCILSGGCLQRDVPAVCVPRPTHNVTTARKVNSTMVVFKHILYLVRRSSALRFSSIFLPTLQLNWTKSPFGSHLKLQTQQELNATILRFGVNNSNKHQMCTSSVSKAAEYTGSERAFVMGIFLFFAHAILFGHVRVQNQHC